MSKFEQYNIVLKDFNVNEVKTVSFLLGDEYFKKIDSPEVQHGKIDAKVTIQKKTEVFEITFELQGVIYIPCDRCLDNMEQTINYKEKLLVKFGARFSEEDEVVIVPESDGCINVAWFLYEFIVLNIPVKHVHPTGECNKTMMIKLKKHITHNRSELDVDGGFEDDEDEMDDVFADTETQIDPRWEGLQNISENN